ncbi:Glycoside hydrolase, family 28 [Dillenia turbinata]|uniref:Glycoside hydrolase, family 28 n=1 Tax=Dillenia turbinata TaxID=194707 RepID=A0AAN8ZGZ6_9MAGN
MAFAKTIGVKIAFFFGLALLSYEVEGALRNGLSLHRGLLVDTGVTVFDVTKYGAKGDGKTNDEEAFIKAWIAAMEASGAAKVLIPKGNYLVGPVIFQGPKKSTSPITVEVQGTVKALTDMSEFANSEWFIIENVDGLIITGEGSLDGQGQEIWKLPEPCGSGNNCALLPPNVKLNNVKNAVVEKITSLNSKGFHFFITNSENIEVHDVKIQAPGDSKNTDGIHLSHSKSINVTNSNIATGDDCIGMLQGLTNVSISGITCGPGHGISIGSLGKYADEKEVRGIVVDNCKFVGTTNGVRIKTWPDSTPNAASDITFKNLVMDKVQNPIIIDQQYGGKRGFRKTRIGVMIWQPSQVKISNVHYKNITGTSATEAGISFLCSEAVPCEGIELSDINLSYAGLKQNLPFVSSCSNVKPTFLGKIFPPACP